MRKCKFMDNNQWIYGYFIQTGIDYEELRDGVGQYTTAIVEDSRGQMHAVAIDRIVMLPDDSSNEDYREHNRIFGW